MERLEHGYTNHTTRRGGEVVKRYQGPGADGRRRREGDALAALAGVLPVPRLLSRAHGALRLGFVAGRHGQELLDEGHAARVLGACGGVLRRLQAVEPGRVLPGERAGSGVLVHGDFGPNNVLLDPEDFAVTAVLDWEWVHVGEAVEDLAWCEWIVRMHHPSAAAELGSLFDAYGDRPPWTIRRDAMVERCRQLLRFTEAWEPAGAGVSLWRARLALTARWTE